MNILDRFLRTRLPIALAASLGILLTAPASAQTCGNSVVEGLEECDDGNTTPGDGCSQFCLTELDNCLNDLAGFNNPTCTANDVTIALILNESEIACELDSLVQLTLLGQLEAGSDERYDIGTFIGRDAGDAKFGTCNHQVLNPATNDFDQVCSISRTACDADNDCTVAGERCLDTDYFPGGLTPPYSCADPFDAGNGVFYCPGTLFHDGDQGSRPNDTCGDLQQDIQTFFLLGEMVLPCVDTDDDGRIDIPTCVSWENNANAAACLGVDDAIPGTPSKCRCEVQNVGNVFIAGKIIVVKETDPDGSTEEFDFTTNYGDPFSLQDGESNDSGSLFPSALSGTTYSVVETVPAGWALTDVTCVSDQGNTVSDETAIDLQSGEEVTCTFTNAQDGRIIVEKQTLPDGDPTTFDFTGDAAGTIGDGGTISEDVAPGSYSSTESVPAGWALQSIVCDDDDSSGTGSTANFEVEAGETVRCVFTNSRDGRIIVEKQTLPDGDPATFNFTGDAAGTIGDGQTISEDVAPGSYSSTETVPAGWVLTSIVCDDANSSGAGTTANFQVEPGETVKCVFTNTKDGRIIVEKQTLPDGDPATFDFTGDVAGTIGDGQTLDEDVAPGSYSSTETVPAGWELTSIVCDDANSSGAGTTATFQVEPGETVKCTFTNTKDGRIIVEKQTLPDGDPAAFDFTGDVAGTIGDGGTLDEDVAPGTYSSTETVPAGWELTSIVCDDANSSGAGTTATFQVEPGETVRCVFTNTKDGRIIVEKQTLPDGDPATFEFTGNVAGTIGDGGTLDEDVAPGTYTSTETVPAGWDLTSIVCDDANSSGVGATATFQVEPGETVRCVFTNTKDGRIIVEKQTLPDGDPATFDFTGDVAGTIGDGGTLAENVAPGSYTSTETVPAGWDLISIVCDDSDSSGAGTTATFVVDPGETVKCTFTNRKRATIILVKIASPNDGSLFDFNLLGPSGPGVLQILGDGNNVVFANLLPGAYTASETIVPPLWDLISVNCISSAGSTATNTNPASIGLAPGGLVACTFLDRQRGSVTLLKTEAGGLPLSQPYSFEIRVGASTTSEGTVIAEDDADVNTGEVIFECADGIADALCRMVDGVARFPAGTYQLCETGMMPAWANTLDGFTPFGATPEGGDNSTECVEFVLDDGELEDFGTVDNIPPPGGDARTIGFWKNWSSCDGHGNQDPVLDETLGDGIYLWFDDDTETGYLVDSCPVAVDLLDKRMVANPALVRDGPKQASDGAYNMSAQLLAALLNIAATAGTCADLFDAVNGAQALLERIGFDGNGRYLPPNPAHSDLLGQPDPAGGNFTRPKLRQLRLDAEEFAGILDAYNNNLLCP